MDVKEIFNPFSLFSSKFPIIQFSNYAIYWKHPEIFNFNTIERSPLYWLAVQDQSNKQFSVSVVRRTAGFWHHPWALWVRSPRWIYLFILKIICTKYAKICFLIDACFFRWPSPLCMISMLFYFQKLSVYFSKTISRNMCI